MKRVATAVVLVAAIALLAAAAASSSRRSETARPATAAAPTKLTVWAGWSSRELTVFKSIIAEYDRKHPELQITVRGSINDTNVVAAIRAGNPPDLATTFDSTNVGNYCSTGAWTDLRPYLNKDHISLGIFPKTSVYYTSYKGVQCALPLRAEGMKRFLLSACRYFASERWELASPAGTHTDPEHFNVFVVLSGRGTFAWDHGAAGYQCSETWLIPAALGRLRITPNAPTTLLRTYVPELDRLRKQLLGEGADAAALSQVVFA